MANYRPLIVNSSAQQIQEITDSDSLIGNGTIPVGGIILWSGTSVPSGWALCDGQNSTPDLRNTFVVGAHSVSKSGITTQTGPTFNVTTGALNESGQYEPGDVGGETAHQLTIAELANHNHTNGMGGGNCESGGQSQSSHKVLDLLVEIITTRTDHHIMLLLIS